MIMRMMEQRQADEKGDDRSREKLGWEGDRFIEHGMQCNDYDSETVVCLCTSMHSFNNIIIAKSSPSNIFEQASRTGGWETCSQGLYNNYYLSGILNLLKRKSSFISMPYTALTGWW